MSRWWLLGVLATVTGRPDAMGATPAPTVRVCLADGAETPADRPAPQGWTDERRVVAFFEGEEACWKGVPESVEAPIHAGGCGCTSTGLTTGVLRFTVGDGQLRLSSLCGSVWEPVRSAHPAAPARRAAQLEALARDVIEHGWTDRCPKQPTSP